MGDEAGLLMVVICGFIFGWRGGRRVCACLVYLLRACLDATVPFGSPIKIALFLPFRNGEKAIFTVETVAQRNGPIVAK